MTGMVLAMTLEESIRNSLLIVYMKMTDISVQCTYIALQCMGKEWLLCLRQMSVFAWIAI